MRTEKVVEALEKKPSMAEGFGEPGETPLYTGRTVAALQRDKRLAERRERAYRVSDMARELYFTDADGNQPEAFRLPQKQE